MPEVSIILPVYNEERHLQKTLSALCTQTFRDFELLAVDDGSTDESRRILERFAAAYHGTRATSWRRFPRT